MTPRKYTAVLIITGAAAVGSFMATHAWQPPVQGPPAAPGAVGCTSKPCGNAECCRSLGGWLRMPPDQLKQIQGIDPTFTEASAKLERTLYEERQRLADLFDDPDATAEDIQQQVERVITADNTLERRVAAHLLALRPHLTAEQRSTLFERCAQGIRQAGGCRWRCGMTTCPADDVEGGKNFRSRQAEFPSGGQLGHGQCDRERHGRGGQDPDQ